MQCLALWVLLAASPLFQLAQADVDAYLSALRARQPDFRARVVDIARQSLGTPYVDGPLGEGPGGRFDTDPLMDLTRVDCVTFVEQTIALAASKSYTEAHDLLQKIRYHDGKIAFESRNHFMISDWIAHNRFCRDISNELKAGTASVTRTIGRKKFFDAKKAPEFADKAIDETATLAYVPSPAAALAEPNLPSPALILFIGKVDWLFCLHCALFIRDENGKGMLCQASSTEGKVVLREFTAPFEKTTRYLGFTAYAISDPAQAKR